MEMTPGCRWCIPVSEYVIGVVLSNGRSVACGVLLNFKQKDVRITGAAIECRINAKGGGKVSFLHVPGGPWVRSIPFVSGL